MELDVPGTLLLVAYASLVLELVVFHVPSEASTYQVFTRDPESGDVGDRLSHARTRPTWTKVGGYLLPTAIGVACFLVPPVNVLVPAVRESLVPMDALLVAEVRWTGLAMVACGRVLTFTSVLQMRTRHAAGALQPDGLFRWSRNPGLVGMYVLYVGAALMTPSAILFVGFIPYVWNMHRRVLMEESHLRRTVGDAYAEYVARVPRYVGWR